MSEIEQTQPQPTMEQISHELNTWLASRDVALQIVAVGLRSGQPCPIDDFLPTTHTATITIVKATK